MMHDEIYSAHSCTRYEQISASRIYVADFTQRTKNSAFKRSVEVSDTIQMNPNGMGVMDSVIFYNANNLPIEFAIFKDLEYHNVLGTNIKHCECVMYLEKEKDLEWIAFLEIKDCKSTNVTLYLEDAKIQIENVVNDFKVRNILSSEKIFGVISCPQCKVKFNDYIFGNPIDTLRYKRTTGINLFGTNETLIISKRLLHPSC